jgi:hypothetical protein
MKHTGINQDLLKCTVVFLLILFCQTSNAQVIEVSDDINNDTTWYADTVKIMNDITVNQGYTLTIGPGTYVEVQGHYKLEVQGCLLAIGTEDNNIIFTVNDTTLLHDLDTAIGGWNGIDFVAIQGDTSKLVHCILEYGKATDGQPTWNGREDSGGSLLCYNNSVPVLIQYCTIRNSYGIAAGAIKIHQGNIVMLDNLIRDNRAKYCSGIDIGYSEGHILRNIITNNFCTGSGGAFTLDNTNGLFVNNLIVNNESSGRPGGLEVNSASTSHSFTFFNNVIANNRTKSNYGGIYMSPPGRCPSYQNNIIWNNQAEGDNYQIYPDTVLLFRYNIIQGGYAGEGNIDVDPMFVNPTEGTGLQYDGVEADWTLQKISPCIDAGKPDFTTDSTGTETDFAGNPRIQNDRIDIGAFEITYCTPVSEPDPDNILINGSFGTCELQPWDVFSSGLLTQHASFRIIEGQCRVMPNGIDPEPDPSHIQLLQELSIPQLGMLDTDSTYELTFDAYAESSNRSCRVFFGMNEEPFTAILDQNIIVGTETESYSFEFTVSEIFPSMKLSFEIGTDSSAITFDNVRIVRIPGEVVDNLEGSSHSTTVIFPNPANDYLKVFTDEGSNIILYNNLGIPVETKISWNKNIVNINIKSLPGGVYFVRISRDKKTSVIKLIIE